MKLCKRQNQKLLTSFVFVSGELKEEHSNVGMLLRRKRTEMFN